MRKSWNRWRPRCNAQFAHSARPDLQTFCVIESSLSLATRRNFRRPEDYVPIFARGWKCTLATVRFAQSAQQRGARYSSADRSQVYSRRITARIVASTWNRESFTRYKLSHCGKSYGIDPLGHLSTIDAESGLWELGAALDRLCALNGGSCSAPSHC